MNFPKKAHIVIFLVAFILNTVTYSQNDAEPWKKLFNGKDFRSMNSVDDLDFADFNTRDKTLLETILGYIGL